MFSSASLQTGWTRTETACLVNCSQQIKDKGERNSFNITESTMAQAQKQKLYDALKPKLEAFHAASSANNMEEIRALFSGT